MKIAHFITNSTLIVFGVLLWLNVTETPDEHNENDEYIAHSEQRESVSIDPQIDAEIPPQEEIEVVEESEFPYQLPKFSIGLSRVLKLGADPIAFFGSAGDDFLNVESLIADERCVTENIKGGYRDGYNPAECEAWFDSALNAVLVENTCDFNFAFFNEQGDIERARFTDGPTPQVDHKEASLDYFVNECQAIADQGRAIKEDLSLDLVDLLAKRGNPIARSLFVTQALKMARRQQDPSAKLEILDTGITYAAELSLSNQSEPRYLTSLVMFSNERLALADGDAAIARDSLLIAIAAFSKSEEFEPSDDNGTFRRVQDAVAVQFEAHGIELSEFQRAWDEPDAIILAAVGEG